MSFPVSKEPAVQEKEALAVGIAHGGERVWLACSIAFLNLIAGYAFSRWGKTDVQNAMAVGVVPAIYLLLMMVWWWLFSRVRLRDRVVGYIVLLLSLMTPVLLQRSFGMGAMLLTKTVPATLNGLVVVLLLACLLRWSTRRWMLVIYLLGCTFFFCLYRVDTISGNFAPELHWRWSPTMAQHAGSLPLLRRQRTALVPSSVTVGDWPSFRGSSRDGCVSGVRFSTDWKIPPRQLWHIAIGPAWSSFILVENYLFTQEQRGTQEMVTCYQADTGETVWQNAVETQFDDAMGIGPRATPSFAGGYLYAQGVTGILQCLEASTGKRLWMRNLLEDAETAIPDFGFASSPLVVEDRLYIFTGGSTGKSLIAYDRYTGDILWTNGPDTTGYSSPHYARIQGSPQVLMVSNYGIQSFNIADGTLLWEDKWLINGYARCIQPVILDEAHVLLGATVNSGTRRLHVLKENGTWRSEEEWTSRQFRPHFNDGVLHKGYYYGFDGKRIVCLDIETGKRKWAGDRYGGQMLLLVDMDMLLIVSEAGSVVLVAATPNNFQKVSQFHALDGKTWNHPLVAPGRLYIRNAQEAACFELTKMSSP